MSNYKKVEAGVHRVVVETFSSLAAKEPDFYRLLENSDLSKLLKSFVTRWIGNNIERKHEPEHPGPAAEVKDGLIGVSRRIQFQGR
jgi:hypothetical protein